MFENLGIAFALTALFGWAFGDYFIQKSVRALSWYTVAFVIGIFGFVGLLPFVWSELSVQSVVSLWPLVAVSALILLYAWSDFEALRIGKLSVIEVVVALELPLAVVLAVMVGGESLTATQLLWIVLAAVGILLAVVRRFEFHGFSRRVIEKGVLLALLASVFSALTYFYVGLFAQDTSPLFVIWFTHTFLALTCGAYIVYRREWRTFVRHVAAAPAPILFAGILDNVAWLSYAYATSLIPISIAVTVSEGYIVLAALLGYAVNGEKLRIHQVLGAAITFASIGVLSLST